MLSRRFVARRTDVCILLREMFNDTSMKTIYNKEQGMMTAMSDTAFILEYLTLEVIK